MERQKFVFKINIVKINMNQTQIEQNQVSKPIAQSYPLQIRMILKHRNKKKRIIKIQKEK
jgi:hypothetical protein